MSFGVSPITFSHHHHLSPSYLLSRPSPLLYPNPPIPHPLRHVRASLVWSVWTALLFSTGRQVRPGEPRHGGSPLKSPPPVVQRSGSASRQAIHGVFTVSFCSLSAPSAYPIPCHHPTLSHPHTTPLSSNVNLYYPEAILLPPPPSLSHRSTRQGSLCESVCF
jgi:hypothetical protein